MSRAPPVHSDASFQGAPLPSRQGKGPPPHPNQRSTPAYDPPPSPPKGGRAAPLPAVPVETDVDIGVPGDYTEVVLQIPDTAAGFVIGKGGSKIKALEQRTGVRVTITKKRPGSADDCTSISVRGVGPNGGDSVERALGELEDAVAKIGVELEVVSVT